MPSASSPRPPLRRTTTGMTAWLAAVHLLLGAPALQAQGANPLERRAATGDSAGVADEGRRAQRRFEGVRRGALRVLERNGPSPCEVRLGRYCYWYDSSARPPVPREAEHVTVARRRLLLVLDSLAAASPADPWIAGQRVRYRIDALDTAGAVGVATSGCATSGWWCDALRGYALHVAGQHARAEAAFDRALAAMPADDRCAWENPAVLLEREERRRVEQLPCDRRRGVAERLWWLGDPQLVRPGNDLRTEFLARRVASVLETDARFVYGTRWSWDTSELLLRYGWPTWWTRERSYSVSGPSEMVLVGHEPVPAFDVLPASRAMLDSTGGTRSDAWNAARAAPVSRYAPAYVTWWRDATVQVARLRRGDTLLVVAAFEAPADSMLRDAAATLALSAGPRRAVHLSPQVEGSRGVVRARIPRQEVRRELLASIEVIDPARRAMARHRVSLIDSAPGGRIALSDLVLHRPLDAPPPEAGLDAIVGHMLPATTIAGNRVGVFWETYGVPAAGEMLDVALTIERLDAPWLRRTAARLRLADPVTPVQIRWKAAPRAGAQAVSQTVSVNVANLAPGAYRLRIRVQGDDGARATSERLVRITRP